MTAKDTSMMITPVNLPPGAVTRQFNEAEALACKALQAQGKIHGVEIHRGSFGRVYAMCDLTDPGDKNCTRKIVKILLVNSKTEANDLQRELYIFYRLRDSGLTPRIYNTFGCGSYFYIVLDRYDTNIEKLGKVQAKAARGALGQQLALVPKITNSEIAEILDTCDLYTVDQMNRMQEIAYQLGNTYGVIHGDLKPDQYLYKNAELFKSEKIVLTDFGFSGTSTVEPGKWRAKHGWNWVTGCNAHAELPPSKYDGNRGMQDVYRKYFNLYQLNLAWRYQEGLVFLAKPAEQKFLIYTGRFFPQGHRYEIPQLPFAEFLRFRCSGYPDKNEMLDPDDGLFPNAIFQPYP